MASSKKIRAIISFVVTIIFLIVLTIYSLKTGSIQVSLSEMYRGLFVEYNEGFAAVYDLRFPRVIVAIIAGAGLSVSGVLLQAVMKNPMTDPGIIGISASASLASSLVIFMFPMYYYLSPIFSVLGGLFAYFLIYTLAWDGGVRPVRLILVGVALNMTFLGLTEVIKILSSGNLTSVQSIIEGNMTQKTWSDVYMLLVYVGLFLVVSLILIRACNILNLEDKTARSLGINVDVLRFVVALVAIILASMTTAVAGVIAFIGLIVPHISRILVGSDHKQLIPYSAILGSALLLLSDTMGRLLLQPYEIKGAVIMSIVGGPFFIFLLKLGGKNYAD